MKWLTNFWLLCTWNPLAGTSSSLRQVFIIRVRGDGGVFASHKRRMVVVWRRKQWLKIAIEKQQNNVIINKSHLTAFPLTHYSVVLHQWLPHVNIAHSADPQHGHHKAWSLIMPWRHVESSWMVNLGIKWQWQKNRNTNTLQDNHRPHQSRLLVLVHQIAWTSLI